MAGPEDQMDSGEIEERLLTAEEGDKVRVVAGGETYEGEVKWTRNQSLQNGDVSLSVKLDSGESIALVGSVFPPESQVGISSAYIGEVTLDGTPLDALQIWNDKYDDWL